VGVDRIVSYPLCGSMADKILFVRRSLQKEEAICMQRYGGTRA
jgi:hypothetical protein